MYLNQVHAGILPQSSKKLFGLWPDLATFIINNTIFYNENNYLTRQLTKLPKDIVENYYCHYSFKNNRDYSRRLHTILFFQQRQTTRAVLQIMKEIGKILTILQHCDCNIGQKNCDWPSLYFRKNESIPDKPI